MRVEEKIAQIIKEHQLEAQVVKGDRAIIIKTLIKNGNDYDKVKKLIEKLKEDFKEKAKISVELRMDMAIINLNSVEVYEPEWLYQIWEKKIAQNPRTRPSKLPRGAVEIATLKVKYLLTGGEEEIAKVYLKVGRKHQYLYFKTPYGSIYKVKR